MMSHSTRPATNIFKFERFLTISNFREIQDGAQNGGHLE